MRLSIVTLAATFAATAAAQNATADATITSAGAAASTAAGAASAPSAAASTAAAKAPGGTTTGKESITIISPTGNKAYNSGDELDITWVINADPSDVAYQFTDIQFEIADASGGANKVTPIGVYLQTKDKNASVGLLDVQSTIPSGIPPGPAYCVRADIRGSTGFTYYFSPTFPINQAMGAGPSGGSSGSSAKTTAASGGGSASQTGAGSAVSTGAAAVTVTKPSGSEKLKAFFGAAGGVVALLML